MPKNRREGDGLLRKGWDSGPFEKEHWTVNRGKFGPLRHERLSARKEPSSRLEGAGPFRPGKRKEDRLSERKPAYDFEQDRLSAAKNSREGKLGGTNFNHPGRRLRDERKA